MRCFPASLDMAVLRAPGLTWLISRIAAFAAQFKTATLARMPERARPRDCRDVLPTGRAIVAPASAGVVRRGTVYLVGAGPGAADLLTLRALRLLGAADVIVHDRLVGQDILDLARRKAERIFVGKKRANHCMPQEEINDLLVRLARDGKIVVRLKGGDPFVFGRGGEEAEALAQAGIACEVVPGVTAALACAAGSGIPLTHRDCARSVTFATGHLKDGEVDIDFASLARQGQTLAIYMGLATLPHLSRGLIRAGLPPGTPTALVESGGTSRQRVLRASLAGLPELAPDWSHDGPTLLIVGDCVARARGEAGGESVALEVA